MMSVMHGLAFERIAGGNRKADTVMEERIGALVLLGRRWGQAPDATSDATRSLSAHGIAEWRGTAKVLSFAVFGMLIGVTVPKEYTGLRSREG